MPSSRDHLANENLCLVSEPSTLHHRPDLCHPLETNACDALPFLSAEFEFRILDFAPHFQSHCGVWRGREPADDFVLGPVAACDEEIATSFDHLRRLGRVQLADALAGHGGRCLGGKRDGVKGAFVKDEIEAGREGREPGLRCWGVADQVHDFELDGGARLFAVLVGEGAREGDGLWGVVETEHWA